jgi:3-oxoacyl-(acyl-carrier-protein) synthase
MKWAIEDAGVAPDKVNYINAHGPSTPLGDATETQAIKSLFGERAYRIPISSTKSMIGHSFAGAGAIEALACVKSIETGRIHPTINYQTPDPNCDLDYVPNQARQHTVNVALSNSFGIGGQNSSLVLGKYKADRTQ